MNESIQNLKIQSQLKNPAIGMVLAFIFGSIGLMYSDIKMGLIMMIPTFFAFLCCVSVIGLIVGIPALFGVAIFNAYWAYRSCTQHNLRVFENAKLEMVEATAA